MEILKLFYFSDEETIFAEIALYKINYTELEDKAAFERVVAANNLRELARHGDFIIIEKTGHKEETEKVFEELKPFGLMGFVRSGRVSLSKNIGTFSDHLKKFELHSKEIITKYN